MKEKSIWQKYNTIKDTQLSNPNRPKQKDFGSRSEYIEAIYEYKRIDLIAETENPLNIYAELENQR